MSKHFYSIDIDDGRRSAIVEEGLGKIEAAAAPIISAIAEPSHDGDERPSVGLERRAALALFVGMSKLRTPVWREQTKSIWEQFLEYQWAETNRRDPRAARRAFAGTEFETLTDEEVDAFRSRLLDDLEAGAIGIEMPVNRLIKEFLSTSAYSGWVLFLLDWTVVRTNGIPFILGDTPVSVHDPTPRFPGSAAGVMSSPNSQVFLPLDPRFGVLITPSPERFDELQAAANAIGEMTEAERATFVDGREGQWAEADARDTFVEELNLRSYAHAQRFVFGSQKAVCDTHAAAKANPARLMAVSPAPPRLHILEDDPSAPGLMRAVKVFEPRSTAE